MLNALIIVWRESLEAMLVIGVLLSWIARQPQPDRLKQGLWLGTGAGLVLAAALGFATFSAQSQLAGKSLEIFQLAMVLLASALILQMVLWMHGRAIKHELEAQAGRAAGAIGIAAITALAVAREGAETVMFLYGLGIEANGEELLHLLGAATAGFLLAAATSWIVARGARFLNYRTLFRVSEILLLLIANALLANAIDRMLAMDWLPPLLDPVWDMSVVLTDAQGFGRVLADFTGYRAKPTGILLLASLAFWSFAMWPRQRSHRPTVAA